MKSVGQRIRDARDSRGLSQEDLAAKAHMATRSLQRIESGDGNPTLETLMELSAALNVSLDWIATGKVSNALPPEREPSLAAVMQKLESIQARLPDPKLLTKTIHALEDEVARLKAQNMVFKDLVTKETGARKVKKKSEASGL